MKKESMDRAKESLEIEAKAITDISFYLDKNAFARAVEVMSKAERIATSGCGNSGIACMKLAHSLCCIEKPAKFIPPGEAPHGGLGFVQKGDVIVLASRGGKTAELMPILRVSKQKEAIVIGITENPESPLALESDILLRMCIERESDKFNIMATSSFVALVAIFDALQVAIMEETGVYSRQVCSHPSGWSCRRKAE